jgi:hypothetical protein
LVVQAGTKDEKFPEYLADDLPVFSFDGFYIIVQTEDKTKQTGYLFVTMAITMTLVMFKLWPYWLREATWQLCVYSFIAYWVTMVVRVLLFIVFYHLGIDFWLFPNYLISFSNPLKILFPLLSVSRRKDMCDIGSLVFRLTSGGLIGYIVYLFFSQETIFEDIQDLSQGLNDLLDYGHDFIIANQLGDSDKNSTSGEKSFTEKIKEEMNKGVEEDFNEDL